MKIDASLEQERKEHAIAKVMVESLNKWYPGHLWAATADLRGGVAQVYNLACSGKYGFIIKLSELMHNQKKLFLAGGEILERYYLSRGAMSTTEVENLEHTATGAVGDIK